MAKKKYAYAPRYAKPVRGGLRLHQTRKRLWWRMQWMSFLEAYQMGARLGRGRNYAQSGQVMDLMVEPGKICATVQGANDAPYSISIEMEEIPSGVLEQLWEEQPALLAQVYARTLPMTLEAALQQMGYSLFPRTKAELKLQCNCRDWSRPCKHLAAVLYLFIDAISVEPAHLLLFRGLALPEPHPEHKREELSAEAIEALRPLAGKGMGAKRLGSIPYWRGEEDLQTVLGDAYDRAIASARSALEGLNANFRFLEED